MPETVQNFEKQHLTLENALGREYNVIDSVSYMKATDEMRDWLWEQRASMALLVRHHLGLAVQDRCVVLPVTEWIRGGFNMCAFVDVGSSSDGGDGGGGDRKVVFRCPMPHRLAEARYPGSINEKLSGEVGASIWIQENCPEIRSPFLFGFGFTDGRHFTHTKHVSLFPRLVRHFWRLVHRILRLPLLSHYVVQNPPKQQMNSAYMVLEYLGPETGQMLMSTYATNRDSKILRQRLFRGISRILLSLARIPQTRIGSFEFHNDGTVTLTNRPLSCTTMLLENGGASMMVPRGTTYASTDAFVSDTISFHDHRFLNQPNAVNNESDCRAQMAVKTLLRVFSHRYIDRKSRHGPFFLQLTDVNKCNILVDKYWNVTGLIDLEWICALPAEMLSVPYWLADCGIDEIEGEEYQAFDQMRREFMQAFEQEEEEQNVTRHHSITLSRVMHETWDSKGTWFWYCLESVNAMYHLVGAHLCDFGSAPEEEDKVLSKFWCADAEQVVQRKLADKQAYNDQLRNMFAEESKK